MDTLLGLFIVCLFLYALWEFREVFVPVALIAGVLWLIYQVLQGGL